MGCSKRPSSKAATSEEARRTLRYVELLSEARTMLAGFFSILLTGITLALSACATGPDLDLTVHESERGGVYVERIPDRSFQAAHPITLSADTMARVLRGVVVKEDHGLLGNTWSPTSQRQFERLGTRTLSTWRRSWSKGSPELRQTRRLGFASSKVVRRSLRNPPGRPSACLPSVFPVSVRLR